MELKYIVTFYCGFGILDKSITVKAFNESEAIAAAMAICQQKKWFQFFETDESIDRMNLTKAEKKKNLFMWILLALVVFPLIITLAALAYKKPCKI